MFIVVPNALMAVSFCQISFSKVQIQTSTILFRKVFANKLEYFKQGIFICFCLETTMREFIFPRFFYIIIRVISILKAV